MQTTIVTRNITSFSEGREYFVQEQDFLTSKTDIKGVIKYANKAFIGISGYSEAELIGVAHNIVRHPDMPRGVFKVMWDNLQSKSEIFAYVKNKTKDNGFYWVFANVTPSYDQQGNIVGYYSVRRKPSKKAIGELLPFYATMLRIEQQYQKPREGAAASAQWLISQLEKEGTNYDSFIFTL